jgi:hypothetical protein
VTGDLLLQRGKVTENNSNGAWLVFVMVVAVLVVFGIGCSMIVGWLRPADSPAMSPASPTQPSVSCDAQEIAREVAKGIERIEHDRERAWRYEADWGCRRC